MSSAPVGRATEMGKPILYITGLSGISDVATIAASLLSDSSDYPVFEAMPVYLRNRVTHRKG